MIPRVWRKLLKAQRSNRCQEQEAGQEAPNDCFLERSEGDGTVAQHKDEKMIQMFST